MLKEFKEFAVKGNVVDLAVGVIIGGAFGKIVTSLVNDIIMPIFSVLTGNINFKDLSFVLKRVEGKDPVTLNYGMFLQNVLDFLIISFSIFMFISAINKLKRREKAEEVKEEVKIIPEQEKLLSEIRDLLKENLK